MLLFKFVGFVLEFKNKISRPGKSLNLGNKCCKVFKFCLALVFGYWFGLVIYGPQYRNEQYDHSFEICVPAPVASRMLLAFSQASQLHFLANKNAELAGGSQ